MQKLLIICVFVTTTISCKKEEKCNLGCKMEFKNSSDIWVDSGYPDNEVCAWYSATINSKTPTDAAGNPISKSDIRLVCP